MSVLTHLWCTEACVCMCVCVQEGGAARGGDGGRHHGLLPGAGPGAGRRLVLCLQGAGLKKKQNDANEKQRAADVDHHWTNTAPSPTPPPPSPSETRLQAGRPEHPGLLHPPPRKVTPKHQPVAPFGFGCQTLSKYFANYREQGCDETKIKPVPDLRRHGFSHPTLDS